MEIECRSLLSTWRLRCSILVEFFINRRVDGVQQSKWNGADYHVDSPLLQYVFHFAGIKTRCLDHEFVVQWSLYYGRDLIRGDLAFKAAIKKKFRTICIVGSKSRK